MVPYDIKSPSEILRIGLEQMGWASRRINKAKMKTNQRRFRCHFGCHPKVVSQIYVDLQTTSIETARIEKNIDVFDLLATIHFLKRYPTEIEREALFNLSAKTIRARAWKYIFHLRQLKHDKITMPDPSTLS